ncbi:hypothetical protein ACFFT8_03855 [Streptomyces purpureus]|uniref:hypothetical protein n=1 Tax=Streptomyces purpureus TaxID=1951 RepID=UPI0035EFFD42
MHLITRAGWGARPYRTPSGATRYARPRRGVKIHYLGSHYTDRPHDRCAAYVRSLQDSHMDGNGWSDIGYSFVVCTHGHVFEGRGLDRRNSANGNTSLNEQDYAVCALVGSSGLTEPTDAQLHGLRDAIDHCRREGAAGPWLGGHKDGYPTSCPGGPLHAWVRAGARRPVGTAPEHPQEETEMPTELRESVAGGPALPAGRWTLVKMAADTALVQGPCAYTVTVYATVTGAPGTRVSGRFQDTVLVTGRASLDLPMDAGTIGPDGRLDLTLTRPGTLPAGVQLRLELRADQPVTLTHRVLRGLRWTA